MKYDDTTPPNRCSCFLQKMPSARQAVFTLRCEHCDYVSCIRHRYHECAPKKQSEMETLKNRLVHVTSKQRILSSE